MGPPWPLGSDGGELAVGPEPGAEGLGEDMVGVLLLRGGDRGLDREQLGLERDRPRLVGRGVGDAGLELDGLDRPRSSPARSRRRRPRPRSSGGSRRARRGSWCRPRRRAHCPCGCGRGSDAGSRRRRNSGDRGRSRASGVVKCSSSQLPFAGWWGHPGREVCATPQRPSSFRRGQLEAVIRCLRSVSIRRASRTSSSATSSQKASSSER